jgi:hypothetical protein
MTGNVSPLLLLLLLWLHQRVWLLTSCCLQFCHSVAAAWMMQSSSDLGRMMPSLAPLLVELLATSVQNRERCMQLLMQHQACDR